MDRAAGDPVKRTTVTAILKDEAGLTLAERTTFAWNSGVRATEAMLREYGRENGLAFTGSTPEVDRYETGRVYRREWTTTRGDTFWAIVQEGQVP